MILRIIVLCAMVLAVSGCAAPVAEEVIVEEEKELIESVESEESEETTMVDDLFAESLTFDTFSEALIAEGYDFTIEFRLASIVEALMGQAYHIGETAIELYEYDPESNYLKDAAENNTIESKNGELVPVAVNGRFILILNDHEESEKLLEIFNRFKDDE